MARRVTCDNCGGVIESPTISGRTYALYEFASIVDVCKTEEASWVCEVLDVCVECSQDFLRRVRPVLWNKTDG